MPTLPAAKAPSVSTAGVVKSTAASPRLAHTSPRSAGGSSPRKGKDIDGLSAASTADEVFTTEPGAVPQPATPRGKVPETPSTPKRLSSGGASQPSTPRATPARGASETPLNGKPAAAASPGASAKEKPAAKADDGGKPRRAELLMKGVKSGEVEKLVQELEDGASPRAGKAAPATDDELILAKPAPEAMAGPPSALAEKAPQTQGSPATRQSVGQAPVTGKPTAQQEKLPSFGTDAGRTSGNQDVVTKKPTDGKPRRAELLLNGVKSGEVEKLVQELEESPQSPKAQPSALEGSKPLPKAGDAARKSGGDIAPPAGEAAPEEKPSAATKAAAGATEADASQGSDGGNRPRRAELLMKGVKSGEVQELVQQLEDSSPKSPAAAASPANTVPRPSVDAGPQGVESGASRQAQSRPSVGKVIGSWCEFEEAWRVVLDDGAEIVMNTESLERLAVPEDGATCGTEVSSFVPGASVQLFCADQPELVGQRGRLVSWDGGRQLWSVELAGNDGLLALVAPGDLALLGPAEDLCPGVRVLITGLKKQVDLNGQVGTVIAWDDDEKRWEVEMDVGGRRLLKRENIETFNAVLENGAQALSEEQVMQSPEIQACFSPNKGFPVFKYPLKLEVGSRVKIEGYTKQPQLNGQIGLIVAQVDGSPEPAYMVALKHGARIAVPEKNLELTEGLFPQSGAKLRDTNVDGAYFSPRMQVPERSQVGPGKRVRVFGLQTRTELNGLLGTVVDWDPAENRWRLLMDDGSRKMLRPENVDLASRFFGEDPFEMVNLEPGVGTCIRGLKSRPDLNGQLAKVQEWDEETRRWKVLLMDGSKLLFRPDNLQPLDQDSCAIFEALKGRRGLLRPGQNARLCFVQTQPELNGSLAVIEGWDEAEGFWKVMLADGARKYIRPENMDIDCTVAPGVGARVKAVGPRISPELVGLNATVVSWVEAFGSWRVLMENGSFKQFRPENLLPLTPFDEDGVGPGARVRITGVKHQPGLNGQTGIVKSWDGDSKGWVIAMDDGSERRLKTANLLWWEVAGGKGDPQEPFVIAAPAPFR